jgi:tetratricopeptide (TPR) repeat protein
LGRYFPPDLFPSLFEETGKSPAMISRSFSLLFALKVTDTPLDPRPWKEDFLSRAEYALGESKETIKTLVRGRLLAWVEQKKINPCFRLLAALRELDGVQDIDDSLVLQSIQGELIYGYERDAVANENTLTETGIRNRIPILRYILDTLQALQSGNLEYVRTAFAEPPPDGTAFPKLKTQMLINQSLYRLSIRENETALETAKEATLLCQDSGGPSLACSYRLLALTSLSRQRISEAVNYLDYALENATKSGNPQDVGMAAYYSASVHLLHGNLSLSQKLAEKARLNFLEAGNPEWADKSRFLEGRLDFETGAYQQAAEIFNDIRYNPSGEMYTEKDRTLAAWAFRALIFGGKKTVPPLRGGGFDADIFNIEARYLTGELQTTDELFAVREIHPYEEFYFTEKPDWRSGFAQSELLYWAWGEFRDRIIGAYRSLILSKISPANGNEATGVIQNILRSGQFPDFDPSDIFLHFACYKILQQTGASQVDISTAVSIAFKRLQGRAGKIDDPEIRRRFLTLPHWNGILTQAAKDFKLI